MRDFVIFGVFYLVVAYLLPNAPFRDKTRQKKTKRGWLMVHLIVHFRRVGQWWRGLLAPWESSDVDSQFPLLAGGQSG